MAFFQKVNTVSLQLRRKIKIGNSLSTKKMVLEFFSDRLAWFLANRHIEYISDMSGWETLFRSPSLKTELVLPLLHTSESILAPHPQQSARDGSVIGS